jgi:4-amino-4-deoxy-L-arabinose transferase-like glycosyltransferase
VGARAVLAPRAPWFARRAGPYYLAGPVQRFVSRVGTELGKPRWWPAAVLILAALILAPRIGSYGFWDPHETKVADQARAVVQGQPIAKIVGNQPPLTVAALAEGVARLGISERAARFPLVLLGWIAVAATLGLGVRLGGVRTGAIAGLVLVTTPLLIFEARQLTSSIGAVAGGALLMLGLVGVAWPGRDRLLARPLVLVGDVGFIVIGSLLAYTAAGALVGVLAPLLAITVATWLAVAATRRAAAGPAAAPPTGPRATRTQLLAAIALTVATVAVFGFVLARVFDLVDASPGDRALFGKTLRPTKEYVAALGGAWRAKAQAQVAWTDLFELLIYGAFPWVAAAPAALGRAAAGHHASRRAWAGSLVLVWAIVAWAVSTFALIKVGPVHYAAFPAVAVAIALWLDDLLDARAPVGAASSATMPAGTAAASNPLPTELPVAALLVVLVVVMLGKDIASLPERFASLHLAGATIKFPDAAKSLTYVPMILGLGFAGALALALARPRLRAFGPWGLGGAFACAALLALFFAHVWTPRLSREFSYKNLFDQVHERRAAGDRLGILSMPGSGPDYYARGDYEKLKNRDELQSLLGADVRSFALAPATELCAIHQAAPGAGFSYFVLDDSNSKFLLLSNRLGAGEVDHNPLTRAILRAPPADIKKPLAVVFEDQIELIGVTMPARVDRGDTFTMTLFFKVLAKPRRNWQIFVHFDGGGMRFQGDHWPVNSRCGTANWQPGDYIVDTFRVTAGNVSNPKTTYQAQAGFFVGSSGNWTNMKVTSGAKDGDNRTPLGDVKLQ